MPPELRENCGEFEAAAAGSLPRLIELENLRGTFHCHTTASDGHNSLEEMAEAAQELGLQYLGIADHSRSSIQAHGLDGARLRAQMARDPNLNETSMAFVFSPAWNATFFATVARLRRRDIVAQLDFVVASVHSAFNLTESGDDAAHHPRDQQSLCHNAGHPTGRLLLKREPYAVDIPAIIDAAAETGTWIEINAAPKRSRSGLALVAAGQRKGSQMRDQSGRASGRTPPGFVVRQSASRAKAGSPNPT